MRTIETVVVGGGQAGLAMSRCLLDHGREHVVLERGRIAQRWRGERWDSLRLLTPNWMTRLPGYRYQGPDPDGFMAKAEVIDYLVGYANSFGAPVEEETTVLSVVPRAPWGDGWEIDTDRGVWNARNVVIATGHCDTPFVPDLASHLDPGVLQMTTKQYRNPQDLPSGGVLVVGASASGAQLADELRRSGREVTLAVGRHSRLPREYLGRDIMWWLDRMGVLDRSIEDLSDPDDGKREPSLQLVGDRPARNVDLESLQGLGMKLVGRVTGADGSVVRLGQDLEQHVVAADEHLAHLVTRIDRYAEQHRLGAGPAARPSPLAIRGGGPSELNLKEAGIETVLWATGFKRLYPWLHPSALEPSGEVRQWRGRTALPGLYVLGLQFMMRRRSSFIDGVGRDAAEIAAEICCGDRHRRAAA
jgi:putative flavoprotein involved in K+ transport